MATFDEIIDDRKQFPDETKITIQGVETTLGNLRGGYMKDADYRRKGQKLADERRQLEQDRTQFVQERLDAEQKLQELAAQTLNRYPGMTREGLQEELADDPAAQKLRSEIEFLRQKTTELEGTIKETREALIQQRTEKVTEQHQRVLAVLKAHDPNLDADELIDFCKREHIPRLDHGYRLMTEGKRFETALQRAKTEGLEEGVKKGKQEAAQVNVPQRRLVTNLLPESSPKSFDEAAAAAEQDPEIVNLLAGQG